MHSGPKFLKRCPSKKSFMCLKNAKIRIFVLSKPLKIKFSSPKKSKLEKLEPKIPKKIHFCAEKVTEIENYTISKAQFFINLVPVCSGK